MKIIAAVLLLPVCFGVTNTLFRVVRETGQADTVWAALLAGFACWVVIYLLLPKPMWVYVVGHELTHVVWTWLFGGKVRGFKATAKGGHVRITKSNFLIALAPYFFPLYAVLIGTIFCLGNLIWGWNRYAVYFHLLVGAAYGFHVTLTWHIMKQGQTDLAEHGYFFSTVVIWLSNALLLVLCLPLITRNVGLLTALGWCWVETGKIFERLQRWF